MSERNQWSMPAGVLVVAGMMFSATASAAVLDERLKKGAEQKLSPVAELMQRNNIVTPKAALMASQAVAASENVIISTLISQDFEGSTDGWTTSGTWEFGEPTSGPLSGYNSLNAAATSLSGNYQNSATDILTMPMLTLPTLAPAEIITLNFAEYYSIESGYDNGYVQISTDLGATWETISSRTGESNGWLERTHDISEYAGQDVMIQYLFTTDGSVTYPGWYLDDVVVQLEEIPAIITDISLINSQNFPFIYTDVDVNAVDGICPEPIPAENFTVLEDGIIQTDVDVIAPNEGDGTRLADIIIIMDNSGSLGDEQEDVENNIAAFVADLESEGIDAAFGLTRFGQSAESGYPILEDAGAVTTDDQYFINSVLPRNVTDGGFEPAYQAIRDSAAGFAFRPGAQAVFIIVADESAGQGDVGITEAADALEAIDGTLFAVTTENLYGDYEALVDDPATQLNNIDDSFDIILEAIVDDLSSTYRVNYRTSNDVLDGMERELEIRVDCDTESGSGFGTYTPGSAPQITLTPETVEINNTPQQDSVSIPISVLVEDNVEPLVTTVTLYYRTTGAAGYDSLAMTEGVSGTWSADIPAESVLEPAVEYYVTATDSEVTSSLPSTDPASEPFSVAVLPNEAPVIVHEPVVTAVQQYGVQITAEASDSTNSLDSVSLFYREYGDLVYTEVAMTNVSGDTYEAVIPGADVTLNGVQYYLTATDNFETTSYSAYPDAPYFIEVEEGLMVTSKIWTWKGEGTVTPAVSEVPEGHVVTMELTPAEGNKLVWAFGCGGTLDGNVFTTAPVTADCQVNVIFRRLFQ